MDIPINAEVRCTDGTLGKTSAVLFNPAAQQVTDIVVDFGALDSARVIVPVDLITESAPDYIQLRISENELRERPTFVQTEFVTPTQENWPDHIAAVYPVQSGMLWPYTGVNQDMYAVAEQIPAGEAAMRRGDQILATDGEVGSIDEFLIDPRNNAITHVILRTGPFWNHHDVTIPVSQIASFSDGNIQLKLSKHELAEIEA